MLVREVAPMLTNVRGCTSEKNNQGTDYNLGGKVIPHKNEEKDLRVIIAEDEKYSKQCAAAANKAMCKLRVLKHTFKHFDKRCFTILYKTYIRPHL